LKRRGLKILLYFLAIVKKTTIDKIIIDESCYLDD